MTKVTNNYNRDLGLPSGFVIGAGKAEDIPGWDKLSKHKVVAKWLESGVLYAGKSSKKDEQEAESEGQELPDREVVKDVQFTEEAPAVEEGQSADSNEEVAESTEEISEDEQKEALIAQLSELDIKADKRSSVEKLQEKLDEALAK